MKTAIGDSAETRTIAHRGVSRAETAFRIYRRAFVRTLLVVLPAAALAQSVPPLEQSVKAAFLQKFPDYVEWPARAQPAGSEPLVVAVMGAAGVASELDQMTGARAGGERQIRVRRIGAAEPLSGVHVLFIGREVQQAAAPALRAAVQQAVLTVTEVSSGLDDGAIVNFLIVDGRVRFEVALDTAERAGLRISSRMLSVAVRVRKG